MNKKTAKILSLAAAILILSGVFAYVTVSSDAPQFSSKDFPSASGVSIPQQSSVALSLSTQGYTELARDGSAMLSYNKADKTFRLQNLHSGFVWSTVVSEADYGQKMQNNMIKRGLSQLCQVSYTDYGTITGVVSSGSGNVTITERTLKNGISLHLNFSEYSFSFDLNVWLENGSLCVNIPYGSIRETDEYGITGIDVLPMLMAAKSNTDGYIFYPDGPGALYHLDRPAASAPTLLSKDVYAPKITDLDKIQDDSESGIRNIMLPVYGIKRGSDAIVAYIEQGDANSAVVLAPQGYIYQINRVYTSVTYRKTYTFTGPQGTDVSYVDKQMRSSNFTVRYMMLDGNDANYSGMARAVRTRMLAMDRLNKKKPDVNVPLNLQVIVSVPEKLVFYENHIIMTTFGQTQTIIQTLQNNGVKNLNVYMLGWQNTGLGVYPSRLPASSGAGGSSGLKRLAGYAKSAGVGLFLSEDYVQAQDGRSGFSKSGDVIYNGVGYSVTDSTGKQFLLDPFRQYLKFSGNTLNTYKNFGVSGVAFDGIGKIVFDDYNKTCNLTRQDTENIYAAFVKKSADAFGHAAVQNGDAYMLQSATELYDIPDSNSGYSMLDESVPFYQMVVHGLINYSSDTPGNLSYDLTETKLKWIEYGSVPNFVITQNDTNLLKDSSLKNIFTSRFADWKTEIININNEFEQKLKDTFSSQMLSHDKLSANVYRSTYDNGVKVYVNYNTREAVADGIHIAARNYAVVGLGGTLR